MSTTTFLRAAAGGLLLAGLFATATGAAGDVPMKVVWSGMPSDDDANASFDYTSNLGIWVGCFLEIENKHQRSRLDIQFSYTKPEPEKLRIVADVRQGETSTPQPRIVKTLDSTNLKQWDYVRYITSCDDRYYVYVGYPK